MVEVGQVGVNEDGVNLEIVSIVSIMDEYLVTMNQETENGLVSFTYNRVAFEEKFGNIIWTTP